MSDEGLSVEQFRRRCVEPMGEESDHVHIVALSDMLRVLLRTCCTKHCDPLTVEDGTTPRISWTENNMCVQYPSGCCTWTAAEAACAEFGIKHRN